MEHAIVLKSEILGFYKNLPVTNTLLVGWVSMVVLTILALLAAVKVRLVPTGIQNLMEAIIEPFYTLVQDLAGEKKAKIFFPYVATFFLYILVGNWLGLLPGFGTVTLAKAPLLRAPNSDLNMTLGLALTSVAVTHIFAMRYLGLWDYLARWISLNPIFLFVGILEIISEFTKLVSLSFRLFGNIFAGEVVLSTVATIFAFLVPLPFYFLEILVGFVQAAVFAMLTLVFMVLLSEKHATEH